MAVGIRIPKIDSEQTSKWKTVHLLVITILKRQCHKIFDLYFFPKSNPSGPLINRLKWFRLTIRFREDIRILSSKNSTLRSVILSGVEFFWQDSPLKC